jgi:hypothetical protein
LTAQVSSMPSFISCRNSFEGFVEPGGLMSYGPSYHATFRRCKPFTPRAALRRPFA